MNKHPLDFEKLQLDVIYPELKIERAENGFLIRTLDRLDIPENMFRENIILFEDDCDEKSFY